MPLDPRAIERASPALAAAASAGELARRVDALERAASFGAGRLLYAERVLGNNASNVAAVNGAFVDVDAAGTDLQANYTPAVNAWAYWEVNVGQIICDTANNLYCRTRCAPADADGLTAGTYQRNAMLVNDMRPVSPSHLFKLAAGTGYTFRAEWNVPGGAFRYAQNSNLLHGLLLVFAR